MLWVSVFELDDNENKILKSITLHVTTNKESGYLMKNIKNIDYLISNKQNVTSYIRHLYKKNYTKK